VINDSTTVIGAGLMGAEIALMQAHAGMKVLMIDVNRAQLERHDGHWLIASLKLTRLRRMIELRPQRTT
jgi:3-hydroxyacyl-CoA dehydrogenase